MKNITNKMSHFWNDHVNGIAGAAIVFSMWAFIMMILLANTIASCLGTIHDMEAQCTAHGVEWALYTPIPEEAP